MFYDPLLDKWCEPVSVRQQWQDTLDTLARRVERAIFKRDTKTALYHLNVVDLICRETGMYYREYGFDLFVKGTGNE